VALAVLVTLVVWQASFSFGALAPGNTAQTFVYWVVSTLVFLLTLTIGFMLTRTAVKLYIERRSNREGSRLRSKMLLGALALSFLPVSFLVAWSYALLNRNLDKWFSRPTMGVVQELTHARDALSREVKQKAQLQANYLAALPETQEYLNTGARPANFLARFCADSSIAEANLELPDGTSLEICPQTAGTGDLLDARATVAGSGRRTATLALKARVPIDLARSQRMVSEYLSEYDNLALNRKSARRIYLMLLGLLTLFTLFVATWITLMLARQISVPIAALLEAAGQVRRGNLGHRVIVSAMDELASLVRSFNEMTESLEANRLELENRRRFTEAILESIPTGVISLSSESRIVRINAALTNILPREAVLRAERLEDLFAREELAAIRHLMKRARRARLASTQMELKTEDKTLQLSITVAALEARATSGFVIVLEDTSELLRAQKAAAWQEVARRVAHEIKNPLTPIALSAERILRQLDRASSLAEASPVMRECANTIVQEVESLKALVNTFSQFARFPAAHPAPCDLNEVVEYGLAVFAGSLEGIELTKHLAPNLPPVSLDREQFKRVIVNLVDNAAEAMQDSLVRRLFISTAAASTETVELVIADTGRGISIDEKETLFLPYFSTKGRGTGLGLAIVSHIIAEHGAQIRAEDNVPVGARFTVEIPALVAAEPQQKATEVQA
jgi:PAS domain S-box-containing protein